jgi:hypothetical protein
MLTFAPMVKQGRHQLLHLSAGNFLICLHIVCEGAETVIIQVTVDVFAFDASNLLAVAVVGGVGYSACQ